MRKTAQPRKTLAEVRAARALWKSYEAAMLALAAASEELVKALTIYLRGGYAGDVWCSTETFYEMVCVCARYAAARRAAEPYHFATIPAAPCPVNHDALQLLGILRAIRGEEVILARRIGDRYVCADVRFVGGVADWVAIELQSMRRFRSPRRNPAESARPPRWRRRASRSRRLRSRRCGSPPRRRCASA